MTESLTFWYELASTYSYPAAMRVEDAAAAAGVSVVWRPFLLGAIMRDQGMETTPFITYPMKGRYMWRDLERLCAAEGVRFRHPSQMPRNSLLAARVARLGQDEPWAGAFARAVYQANFADDRDIADPAVIGDILSGLGLDAKATLERAQAQDNKDALRAQTEEAKALGIFGAPSMVVDGELFWGGDRLDLAIAWARGDRPL